MFSFNAMLPRAILYANTAKEFFLIQNRKVDKFSVFKSFFNLKNKLH